MTFMIKKRKRKPYREVCTLVMCIPPCSGHKIDEINQKMDFCCSNWCYLAFTTDWKLFSMHDLPKENMLFVPC